MKLPSILTSWVCCALILQLPISTFGKDDSEGIEHPTFTLYFETGQLTGKVSDINNEYIYITFSESMAPVKISLGDIRAIYTTENPSDEIAGLISEKLIFHKARNPKPANPKLTIVVENMSTGKDDEKVTLENKSGKVDSPKASEFIYVKTGNPIPFQIKKSTVVAAFVHDDVVEGNIIIADLKKYSDKLLSKPADNRSSETLVKLVENHRDTNDPSRLTPNGKFLYDWQPTLSLKYEHDKTEVKTERSFSAAVEAFRLFKNSAFKVDLSYEQKINKTKDDGEKVRETEKDAQKFSFSWVPSYAIDFRPVNKAEIFNEKAYGLKETGLFSRQVPSTHPYKKWDNLFVDLTFEKDPASGILDDTNFSVAYGHQFFDPEELSNKSIYLNFGFAWRDMRLREKDSNGFIYSQEDRLFFKTDLVYFQKELVENISFRSFITYYQAVHDSQIRQAIVDLELKFKASENVSFSLNFINKYTNIFEEKEQSVESLTSGIEYKF